MATTGLEESLGGVQGWLTMDEAHLLYEAVVSSPAPDPVVVEIGAWKGRSTIALGMAAKERADRAVVYSIDPHLVADASGRAEYLDRFGQLDTFAEFGANLERAGVAEWVTPMRMLSFEARPHFSRERIDVLFIDGSHEYADVVKDIDDWVALVPSGGVVAFNDPSRAGVNRALISKVISGSPYTKPRLCRNTLAFTIERTRSRAPDRILETLGTRVFLRILFGATKLRVLLPRPLLRAVRACLSTVVQRGSRRGRREATSRVSGDSQAQRQPTPSYVDAT